MSASKKYSAIKIVEQSDQICEWVKAGVLNYKLCDREFDCENCPLDKILRSETNIHKSTDLNLFNFFNSLGHLTKIKSDNSFFMNQKHIWIRRENSHRAKIGIDDVLATVLGSIKSIVLPAVDDGIEKGKYCGQIIQDEFIFNLQAPISGKVVQINQDLKSFPNKATLDPLNKGWLMQISPTNLTQDLGDCRTGENLLNWYLKETKWLNQKLQFMSRESNAQIGLTMADGGEFSREIRRSISANDYRYLVNYLLGNPFY